MDLGKKLDFIENILRYYHTESRHGYIGAGVGALLLVSALLLWKFANPLSLFKGLSLPFLIIGLIMGIGGSLDGYTTRRALPGKMSLYREDQQAFFKEEVPKVERTHRSWFGIRIFWSVITVAGVALLFTVKKNYWIGVGLGTLLLGAMGHIEEAVSFKFNEKYRQEVLDGSRHLSSVFQEQNKLTQ